MVLTIRDVQEHDLDAILALNNAAEGGISALDRTRLQHFYQVAGYFRVAELDGHMAGFLIALREDARHDEPHFHWFRDHRGQFVFIDRIVIANTHRRHGLGRVFYCDVQSYAEVRAPVLTCAVHLDPRDDVAILFHGTYGFQEVTQYLEADGIHHTSLLEKPLDNYAFVRQTYGELETDLPREPWLQGRPLPLAAPSRLAGNGRA